MKDLNIILDYIHNIQLKEIRITRNKHNKKAITTKYNTEFTCETVYVGNEEPTNYSVYLITGDFIPFLFSNNKIYKVYEKSLNDYIHHSNHKLFLYNIQQINNGEKIDDD